MSKIDMASVREKLKNGDSLTDEECSEGARYFLKLSDELSALGPHFYLAAQESRYTGLRLDDCNRARAAATRRKFSCG